jgi:hypothetical protein
MISLVIFSLALLAASSSYPRQLISPASALADINHFHHFEQRTVSRSGWAYMLKIKWSRGRLVGEPCGGFKNWRCASGLYCERRRGDNWYLRGKT